VSSLSCTRAREVLFSILNMDVRKVYKDALLREIYHCAQNSFGLPIALHSLAVSTLKLQVARFAELNEQCHLLEAMADQFLSQRSDYQRLRSLPGVGRIVALIIVTELASCGALSITVNI
jgi:transposase